MKTLRRWLSCALALLLAACGMEDRLTPQALDAIYEKPLTPPGRPLRVFHLGHSLVNRDMPLMLEQLAGQGHDHRSQLGWGASLKAHWTHPGVPVNGFAAENAHPRYEDARQALGSGRFDVVVLTEAVEIRDSIKYQDSGKHLRLWAQAARKANPDVRLYLYETWHRLNDPRGWLQRLDEDLGLHWEGTLLAQAQAGEDSVRPIHVIPAGQVLARFVRELEARGGVGAMRSREDLFAVDAQGARDPIHLSALGNFLVAMTHYAVLYHRQPPVSPPAIRLSDGSLLQNLTPELVQLMSEVVWSVVTTYPKTGVSAQSG